MKLAFERGDDVHLGANLSGPLGQRAFITGGKMNLIFVSQTLHQLNNMSLSAAITRKRDDLQQSRITLHNCLILPDFFGWPCVE